MARTNTPLRQPVLRTHEGGIAERTTNLNMLRRSVMATLLWENGFYEDGQEIGARITQLAEQVTVEQLASIAVEARSVHNLRHVPLLLVTVLARRSRGNSLVSDTLEKVIQRADELTEFVALYAKANGVQPNAVKKKLSAQVKLGLAAAFRKFDEYQLAKYDREGAVRLRDVLYLVHPSPVDATQQLLWDRLHQQSLAIPDTWEVQLSKGADKGETFTRLLREGKLGYLALLRNLRNMEQSGVDRELIRSALLARKGAHRVLPFRFTAAARIVPSFERDLDAALCASIAEMKPLDGTTFVLVDVSDSMNAKLSGKSDLSRMDAGATLAAIIPGDVRMFSFSYQTVEVPPRRGMAGVDAIKHSQGHGGTNLAGALDSLNRMMSSRDRLIVVTDEQHNGAFSRIPQPVANRAYMINVANARNGVGYGGKWVHIDGFSEAVLKYIDAYERSVD